MYIYTNEREIRYPRVGQRFNVRLYRQNELLGKLINAQTIKTFDVDTDYKRAYKVKRGDNGATLLNKEKKAFEIEVRFVSTIIRKPDEKG